MNLCQLTKEITWNKGQYENDLATKITKGT
jgi:hypothetical protein